MYITKVECIPITSRFSRPFPLGNTIVIGPDSLILKLYADDGTIGFADTGGLSFPYSGESQESAMALIMNVFAPRLLLGEDPFDLERISVKMEALARANFQAKAVVDMALHDLVARILNIPVYKLLGGKSNEKIRLCYVLSEATPEKVVETGLAAKNAGFKALKLKVAAGTEQEDVAKLAALREAVGDDITIWADANCGWDYYQALTMLKKFEKYNLGMLEQPVPYWDIDSLARLRTQSSIPIFADESATEPSHVLEIIKKNAADGLLIKVAKAGGYVRARKWMNLAESAGIGVCCGCFMGNGIEAAEQVHFLTANAWAGHQYHENLGPLHLYDVFETAGKQITSDAASEIIRYENGFQYVPEGPGLGITLNEDVIGKIITEGMRPVSKTYKK